MRCLLLLVLAAAVALPAEKESGWVTLFDGSTMHGWRDPAKENPPGDAWVIEAGCLKTRLRPRISEDLITQESYADFEMTFDWRVSERGNTGVKYRIQRLIFLDNTKAQMGAGGFEGMLARELANPQSDRAKLAPEATGQEYAVAFEMQLLDDARHPDAKNGPKHMTGALYGMIAPTATPSHSAGEWNSGRILVKGDHVEHWINGVKVMEGSLVSEEAREGAARRWGKAAPAVLEMLAKPKPAGPISLQHHGDEVWFRNIRIRRL